MESRSEKKSPLRNGCTLLSAEGEKHIFQLTLKSDSLHSPDPISFMTRDLRILQKSSHFETNPIKTIETIASHKHHTASGQFTKHTAVLRFRFRILSIPKDRKDAKLTLDMQIAPFFELETRAICLRSTTTVWRTRRWIDKLDPIQISLSTRSYKTVESKAKIKKINTKKHRK